MDGWSHVGGGGMRKYCFIKPLPGTLQTKSRLRDRSVQSPRLLSLGAVTSHSSWWRVQDSGFQEAVLLMEQPSDELGDLGDIEWRGVGAGHYDEKQKVNQLLPFKQKDLPSAFLSSST